MNIYSCEDIKAKGDCIRYMKEVMGQKPVGPENVEWVAFNSPFRAGSNSGAFKVSRVGYHDFVSEETGSIIDLCISHKGCTVFEAADHLGQWLCLEPRQKVEDSKKLVATYSYTDLTGNVVHESQRFESPDGSKTIRQRRPNPTAPGEFVYSLEGIEPVLYRWPEWHEAPSVIVVEGEKCADVLAELELPATTNAMGAGKWLPHYTAALAGKRIILIPDNDDPGEAHMANVATALMGVAKDIRIVHLDGLAPKEDVWDWIRVHNHTKDELIAAIKAATILTAEQLGSKAVPNGREISEAKSANETPFSNYEWVTGDDGNVKKRPLAMKHMLSSFFRRFWGFPRRVGSKLFDHDRKSGEIRLIDSPDKLFAWINEKSGHPIMWAAKIEGCVTKSEFFSGVFENAQRYDAISGVPSWPIRKDVYYTFGALPLPTQDCRYFNRFVSFFSFATEEDANLFRVLCASTLYFRHKVDRPLWIIDSTDGQGSGKTKAAEYLAYLLGGEDRETCEPMWVTPDDLRNSYAATAVQKRILSPEGRKKRIIIIDNVVGHFRSSILSTLITQGSISGLAPYGHGEETRPNDLTAIITVNSAAIESDSSDRCFIIFVKKPIAPPSDWARQVVDFIEQNRMKVIADIIGMLDRGPQGDNLDMKTRFRSWEADVMSAILSPDSIEAIWKQNEDRKRDSNTDMDEASVIEQFFSEKLDEVMPTTGGSKYNVWLTNRLVSMWANAAISGFGGEHGRNAAARIKNMVKARQSSMFDATITRKMKLRGILWHGATETDPKTIHHVLDIGTEGGIKFRDQPETVTVPATAASDDDDGYGQTTF